MIFSSDIRREGVRVKDRILELLQQQDMTCRQLEAILKLGDRRLEGHLNQLKGFGYVEFAPKTAGTRGRPYRIVPNMGTYAERIKQLRPKSIELASIVDVPKFSPYATMQHSSHDDHPQGNKSKINPWSGYTSFGGV